MNDSQIELLADLMHEIWADWAVHMLHCLDASLRNGMRVKRRWRRQIATPYKDLKDAEQESDREVARRILEHLERQERPESEPERISDIIVRQIIDGKALNTSARLLSENRSLRWDNKQLERENKRLKEENTNLRGEQWRKRKKNSK